MDIWDKLIDMYLERSFNISMGKYYVVEASSVSMLAFHDGFVVTVHRGGRSFKYRIGYDVGEDDDVIMRSFPALLTLLGDKLKSSSTTLS